jgi:hypothetical protein
MVFIHWLIDWLFTVLRPLKNISLIWRRHHCRGRAAKFRPMLGAQGLWAGRALYRATPTVTRDLGFSGLIRRTAPFSRLLRNAWGCGGPILTRILTGRLYIEYLNIYRSNIRKIDTLSWTIDGTYSKYSSSPCWHTFYRYMLTVWPTGVIRLLQFLEKMASTGPANFILLN